MDIAVFTGIGGLEHLKDPQVWVKTELLDQNRANNNRYCSMKVQVLKPILMSHKGLVVSSIESKPQPYFSNFCSKLKGLNPYTFFGAVTEQQGSLHLHTFFQSNRMALLSLCDNT